MLVNDGNGRNGNVSTSAMETKSVIGNVDYNRIRQSASILQGVAATDNLNESNTISNLINIDLTGVSRQHDGYLDDTIAKYDNQGSMGLELENANNDLNMLISNSNEIADSWEDLDTNTPGNVHSGLQKIDEILGLEGDSSLGNMYSSTSTDDIAFYTNALAVEGFISGSAYLSDYYPSLEYRTKATWAAELIQKYQDQGYSEEDARELANLEMVETAIEATGGESHEQALSDIESLRENYEIEGTSQDTETEETPSEKALHQQLLRQALQVALVVLQVQELINTEPNLIVQVVIVVLQLVLLLVHLVIVEEQVLVLHQVIHHQQRPHQHQEKLLHLQKHRLHLKHQLHQEKIMKQVVQL